MPALCVRNLSVSLDGYAAGPDQSLDNPIGVGGGKLHEWIYPTRTFSEMIGVEGGEVGVDDTFIAAGDTGIGATIMGRNMFGPIRGPWPNADWNGWWGDEPPYHHPVFVLTNYPRPAIPMSGGTTFHFVSDGIHAALDRARDAAGDLDVRVGGGVATVQQYLRAGLIDELQLAVVPILLGGGERLFDDLGAATQGLECVEFVASPSVIHVRFAKTLAASA